MQIFMSWHYFDMRIWVCTNTHGSVMSETIGFIIFHSMQKGKKIRNSILKNNIWKCNWHDCTNKSPQGPQFIRLLMGMGIANKKKILKKKKMDNLYLSAQVSLWLLLMLRWYDFWFFFLFVSILFLLKYVESL